MILISAWILLKDATLAIFLGQVSQMCKFIDQINLTSKCATPVCNGKLKLVSVSMIGQQGCVTLQYDCTGCA